MKRNKPIIVVHHKPMIHMIHKAKPLILMMLILFLFTIQWTGCRNKNKLIIDLAGIEANPRFLHFEDALFSIPDTLFFEQFPAIYKKFPGLFLNPEADSLVMSEMLLFATEPRFIELYDRKQEVMGDFAVQAREITEVLRHYRYYFPEAPGHRIYTHIPGLDLALLNMPVTVNDTMAVICTDFFLGSDFEPYGYVGIPEYKRRWMDPSQIAPEFARQLAFLQGGSPDQAESILEQMIYQGKILYFMDAMMPMLADTAKIRFTTAQMEWLISNQRHVWSYMVNNQMLFSSDLKHSKILILDAPFTAVFSEEAPPRMGHWFGWQIVRKYMEKHPDITLKALMMLDDAQAIFEASGYKPR
jgi:hypothetical protein